MDNNQEREPSKLRLFLIVIFGNLTSFSLGTCIAWPSPMMSKLKNQLDDSPLKFAVNRNQERWIFTLITIGAVVSAVAAGSLADQIGRKITMIAASFLYIAAYAATSLVTSIETLYLGRLLQGLGAGTTMTVIPMYVGEIATRDVRGSALSLMLLFMTLGMLFVNCIGPFTHYLVLQACCLLVPALTLWGYMYVPESPFYLVGQGRIDEALKSLEIVRGQDIDIVKKELPLIQAAVEDAKAMTKGKLTDVVQNPANRRAMIINIGLMVFQQFSGAAILVLNAQFIFMHAEADAKIESASCLIIVGVIQVCFSTIHQFIVDNVKRRTLLRTSAVGMGIAHFVLGTYLFIQTEDDTSASRWLPLIAFILFQFSYRIGYGPLPFTFLGELFPPNIKAIAATSFTLTCWILGFLIAHFYPMFDSLGPHFVFWTFSIFCGLAYVFAQFVVIETHDYALTQIQDQLKK